MLSMSFLNASDMQPPHTVRVRAAASETVFRGHTSGRVQIIRTHRDALLYTTACLTQIPRSLLTLREVWHFEHTELASDELGSRGREQWLLPHLPRSPLVQ